MSLNGNWAHGGICNSDTSIYLGDDESNSGAPIIENGQLIGYMGIGIPTDHINYNYFDWIYDGLYSLSTQPMTFSFDDLDDIYYEKDRMRGSDAKKREAKQISDALGKNRAQREGKSKDLHDAKKGGGNDRNKPYKDLLKDDFWNSKLVDEISEATGLTGTALVIYIIISEGSRLFPPRNLIPVP